MANQQSSRPVRAPETNRTRDPNRHPSNSKKRKIVSASIVFVRTLILVGATIFFCVFMALFILRSASDTFGLNQENREELVEIPEDLDIPGLTEILVEKGIVDQKFTFNLYANLKKDEIVIKPGTYTLNKNMAYDQIFSLLRTGDRDSMFVTISFPEGLTLDEIANILEEKEVCSADEFLEYLQKEEHMTYNFYNKIPKNENRYLKMEGYVFPDTYEFYIDEKVPSVVGKFLSNFDRRLNNQNLIDRMAEINMTMDEVITLASVIQREAGDPSEMKRVSSVFHNRLDSASKYPQLQSDVTLNYAEDHIKNKMRHYTIESTQEVLDAYNTYECNGLPVGPICNPGEEAIMAALYPAQTNYYYFLTDVNGDYYYAVNLDEHNKYKVLAEEQDESGKNWVGGVATHEGEDTAK